MPRIKQPIWIGLAHVKTMGSRYAVANGAGAQVYIAIWANTADEFEAKAVAIFRRNNLQVLGIDHIETHEDVPHGTEDPIANEKIALFEQLSRERKMALWGKFYPYGELEV